MAQRAWQPWSGDGDDRSGTGGATYRWGGPWAEGAPVGGAPSDGGQVGGQVGGTRGPDRDGGREPIGGGPADRRPSRSIPLGRIAGIPIRMHWSFLLLLGFVAFVEWPGGLAAEAAGAIWIAALFAFVVVHELAHCLVARRRGGSVIDILLLPIGGMSRMDRIPAAPADEAAVAAAGPATSLALGALLLAVGAAAGSSLWPPTLVAGSWWARLGWLNLLLGAFNLLPALPMDGGRVLRAALTHGRTRARATRIAASVAHVVAAGLVLAGVFWDFWLVVIGLFVWIGASGEVAQVEQSERQDRGPRQRTGGPRPPGWGSQSSWVPPPGWAPPGWAPPGWAPPPGWVPPAGWAPPPGWVPPADQERHWPPPSNDEPVTWPTPTWRPPMPSTWPPPAWPPPTPGLAPPRPPAWLPPAWPAPTSAQGRPPGTGPLSPGADAQPEASRPADEDRGLPVDVAVERRRGDTRGGQPAGEHVG